MRIISGKFRNRKIFSASLGRLRPTSDRARETLFNILAHRINFEGMKCLDLFAGTGALGFEALSRGAACCDFVDASREAVKLIRETAVSLNCARAVRIIRADALDFLAKKNSGYYDVIFADPPYTFKHYNQLIPDALSKNPKVFVLEHSIQIEPIEIQNYNVISRKIGRTSLRIYQRESC